MNHQDPARAVEEANRLLIKFAPEAARRILRIETETVDKVIDDYDLIVLSFEVIKKKRGKRKRGMEKAISFILNEVGHLDPRFNELQKRVTWR